MTQAQRIHYWEHPEEIVGKIITVKRFEYGIKDLPRFCTFKAFYA